MVKWTTEEQLKVRPPKIKSGKMKSLTDSSYSGLLLSASRNFKFNAKAVVAAWPAGGDEDPPTERAAKDRYNMIMQHGRDVGELSKIKKEATGSKSGVKYHACKDENTPTTPKPALSTLSPRIQFKARNSSTRKPSIGSERKRHERAESSDTEMASEPETEMGSEPETCSDSETAVETPSRSTRSLRARKPRVAAVVSEESDMEVEAGTKDYGSGDSDEDYALTKKREDEAAKKLEVKLAARRG